MPTFAVQDLIQRAADIADVHDNFVSPSTWLSWFNIENKALSLKMARKGGAMANIQTASVPVGSADQYQATDLGAQLAVVGVWEIRPDFTMRNVRIVPYVDSLFQAAGGPITGPAQVVNITRSSVNDDLIFRFFPRDPSGIYHIMTHPRPNEATSVLSTQTFPMGLEERVVLGMARRALIKEESDPSGVDGLIKELDQHVEDFCWGQTFAQAQAVRNTDGTQRGWYKLGSLQYPTPDAWYWL